MPNSAVSCEAVKSSAWFVWECLSMQNCPNCHLCHL